MWRVWDWGARCDSSPHVPDLYQSRDDCSGAWGRARLRRSSYSALSLPDTNSSDSQRAIWVCRAIIRVATWNKATLSGPEPKNAGSAFVDSTSQRLKRRFISVYASLQHISMIARWKAGRDPAVEWFYRQTSLAPGTKLHIDSSGKSIITGYLSSQLSLANLSLHRGLFLEASQRRWWMEKREWFID